MQNIICFILRQNGVLLIKSITKHSVIMHIIGKTSEENVNTLIIIPLSFVLIGKQVHLLVTMMKDVYYNHLAKDVMDGRNKNIIQ